MYKFVSVQGKCGAPYNIGDSERIANDMAGQGYELVQVYQTMTSSCVGQGQSTLVMVFKQRNAA